MVRRWFFALSALALIAVGLLSLWWPGAAWSLLFIGPLVLLGIRDSLQRKHTVLRNFPVIGHGRYFMEMVRPEIQQYFIESNIDAFPIEREMCSVVYRRIDDLRVRNLGELYDFLEPGQLLHEDGIPEGVREEWNRARPDCWSLEPETGQYGGAALREASAETGV